MPLTNDMRQRLRRLGLQRGANTLPPAVPLAAPRSTRPTPLEALVSGREAQTKHGPYFVITHEYDLTQPHGLHALGDWLHCDPATTSRLSRNEIADLSEFAFFDIETTGLGGGAGLLAFLIGVGTIEDQHYVLRQYFLRDPSEERALLSGLAEVLHDRVGLVTYNGRAFDVPIVESRFILSRQRTALRAKPNLDLLPYARRLWRGQYENCSLSTLERAVLAAERTEEDVPGMLIPQMYVDYLRSGDASQMVRVIYHNAQDILSLTALAAHIVDIFADPLTAKRSGDECLRLALWHDDGGRAAEAEAAYTAAQQRPLTDAAALVLYQRYGTFLKKQNRRAEAVSLWAAWADLDQSDLEPCLEIAKYYEWEAKEVTAAREWASRALLCVTHWRKDWRREAAWNDIKHRLERLQAKG